MASFHITVSDSVFPNLDPARQVLATIGAELRMADSPTPEGIVAAAASSDGLLVTYATPPTDAVTLQKFYDRIRPAPRGWRGAVDTGDNRGDGSVAAGFLAWFLGCLAVYAALFGTGYLLYGRTALGLICVSIAVVAAYGLYRTIPKISFWTD